MHTMNREEITEMNPELSAADVAKKHRISRTTVYRLIYSGSLTATRIGGQWRVDPTSLETYLAAQTRPAIAQGSQA